MGVVGDDGTGRAEGGGQGDDRAANEDTEYDDRGGDGEGEGAATDQDLRRTWILFGDPSARLR